MKKNYLILLSIVVLGAILRFYALGIVPSGFHMDEAYFGYNAYSILKTGREITGGLLPLHLASFLFSPASYSYFTIPFIMIFGLAEFSTRSASALFGTLTIIVTYFLVVKVFNTSNFFKNNPVKNTSSEITDKPVQAIALVSALFLAISPWHINLSRVATENVLVVFFITCGTWLYLKWTEKFKPVFLLSAFALFVTSLFTYQAPRSFLPFFIPLLFFYSYFTVLKGNIQKLILPLVLFILVIIIPVVLIIRSPNLSFRIRTLSIFQNPQTKLVLDEQAREDGISLTPPVITRIFHNKILDYSSTFLTNYFKHFSYDFLFTDAGFPDRYRIPGMGLLYLFDLPLLVLGVWFLFSRGKNLGILITGWVLLAPLGSALTFDDIPNLQRTLIAFPALPILTASGLYFLQNNISKPVFRKVLLSCAGLILVFSTVFYLHAYYIHSQVHRTWYRQEGYKSLVNFLDKNYSKYRKIVVSESAGSPAIFIFFYGKYDPKSVQQIIKTKVLGKDYGNVSFGKYQMDSDDCPVVRKYNNEQLGIIKIASTDDTTLYVNSGNCKIPKAIHIVKIINRGDQTAAFKLTEYLTNPAQQ